MESLNTIIHQDVDLSTEVVDGEDSDKTEEIKAPTTIHDVHSSENWDTVVYRLDQLTHALREIQEKVEMIQESRTKSSGCGFSCSNNSFAL